ncbi:hypothetical protein EJD88_21310 [Pseudomonas sp. PB105]|nr:hypothetical protein EJD88_21310 [Pseudomonas sp. PB105]
MLFGDDGNCEAGDSGGQQELAGTERAHGVGPVVIGVMQVAAMVRGGTGAMKVGAGGFWAVIERL